MTEILSTIGLTLLSFAAASFVVRGLLWLRDQRSAWKDISNGDDVPHGFGKSVRLLLPPSRSYSVMHRGKQFRGVAGDTMLQVREHVGEAVGDCWAHFGERHLSSPLYPREPVAGPSDRTLSVDGVSGSEAGSLHIA